MIPSSIRHETRPKSPGLKKALKLFGRPQPIVSSLNNAIFKNSFHYFKSLDSICAIDQHGVSNSAATFASCPNDE